MQDQKHDEWFPWQRNVHDRYKSWDNEAIKADLKAKALPCALLMAQIEHDFNIGALIRNANAFGCFTVFYYGRRHIDRRGCLGSYKYIDLIHLPAIEAVEELKSQYSFVGLENNVEGTVPLKTFIYPDRPLFIFGEEKDGIQPDLMKLLDHVVEIPANQGSVRSLNVGVSSGITLYDYYIKRGG